MRKHQASKLILGLSIFIAILSGCKKIDDPQQTTLITDISIQETSSPMPLTKVTPAVITSNPAHDLDSKDLSLDITDDTLTSVPEEVTTDQISNSPNVSNSSPLTAEETIQQYFKYWQEKNPQGMDSLIIEDKKGADAQLDYLNSITLDRCVERTDKGNWDILWYENPYDYTCVDVSFTINNKDGEAVALSDGTYDWQYYLVKASENSNWIIVMWGAKEGE